MHHSCSHEKEEISNFDFIEHVAQDEHRHGEEDDGEDDGNAGHGEEDEGDDGGNADDESDDRDEHLNERRPKKSKHGKN